MKVLKTFSNELEAKFAQQRLELHNIQAHIDGAKNYQTHILGGVEGRYQLLVDTQDFETAQNLVHEIESAAHVVDGNQRTPNYFRKSVSYAVAAMVFGPIILNIVSILEAKKFWQHSKKNMKAFIQLLLIFALQLPEFIFAVILFRALRVR